jgi:DNA polymerase III sliding clamp (beta) subunit (PCNA family)
MIWKSSPVIKKHEKPILTPTDIPYKATLVFNAGVTKFNGKYVMDYLKIIDDDFINLNLNSAIDPCVMTGIRENGLIYLILPVRISA